MDFHAKAERCFGELPNEPRDPRSGLPLLDSLEPR